MKEGNLIQLFVIVMIVKVLNNIKHLFIIKLSQNDQELSLDVKQLQV